MKNIVIVLLLLVFCISMASCDVFNPEKEEDGYETAMDQLEEEGKVRRDRRIDLVKEIIKVNEKDSTVSIDKEKLGIE